MASEPTPPTTTTGPVAPAPVVDLSAQPYFYTNPDGSFGGVGATKPWTIPGTPEYEVTNRDEIRSANEWVFESLGNFKAYSSSYESGYNFAVFGSPLAPNTKEGRDAAAWKIIKHDRPASEHNAGVVYDRLYKFANDKKLADRASGVAYPTVFGLDSDEELVQFISNPENNIPTAIAAELVKEVMDKNYYEERRRFGIDIKGKIQRRLLDLDDRYKAGEQVAASGFKGMTEQARIAAFRDLAYFHQKKRGVNFVNDAAHAAQNFIIDGITAIGGAVDALLPTAKDEYLSQEYRKDPVKAKKAEEVMRNAIVVLQKPIEALHRAQRSGNGYEFKHTLDHYTDFDNPDNQDIMKAMAEMAALRADGAFVPGKTGEKLASFGAGVIEGIPTFKHFVGDSLDPGSILFLGEKNFSKDVNAETVISSAYASTAIPLKLGKTVIEKFQDNSKFWDGESDEEVLRASRQWEENWNNVNTKTGNAVASAFDAIGMAEAANVARTAYGDTRLMDAATATIDPITLGLGATALIGRMTGSTAMTAAKFSQISDRGKALLAEGKALSDEVRALPNSLGEIGGKTVPLMEKTVINDIIEAFKKATGRVIDEGEALTLVMAGQADDIIKGGKMGQDAAYLRKVIIEGLEGQKMTDLVARIREFQAKAAAHANDIAGVEKSTRPVSGWLANIAGKTTEYGGRGIRKMGEFMGGGTSERVIAKRGINYLLNNQSVPWVKGAVGLGAIGGGAYWTASSGGEWYTGGLAGIISAGALLRPQMLVASGASLEAFGRVSSRVSKVAATGERVSGSPLRAAINGLRTEAANIPNTAENAGRRYALAEELRMMKWMENSGWEEAVKAGFHVVVDDVIHGGTMGAAFAWANDRSTAGHGFGVGGAYGTSLRFLGRFTEVWNKPVAQEIRSKQVIGELLAIDQSLDPHQSARLRQYLAEGKTFEEFIERADSYRRAHQATNGRIQLTNSAEMAAMTVALHKSPEMVKKIRDEANATHPDDPTAAALYAEQRLADLAKQEQSKVNLDALSRDLADSNRRLDDIDGTIDKVQQKIETEKQNLANNGLKESKRLAELEAEMQTHVSARQVTLAENMQLKAEHSEAQRQVENPIGFRRFEERTTPNGNLRQIKEGLYVHEGPNSHTIYFDVTKGDPFAMFHETWEALLHDDAVRPMAQEMTAILWGGEGRGQRISDQARDVFFTTYSNNLSAPEKAAFDASLSAAKKLYQDTGSTHLLDRYTREALAWWMATIDTQGRPAVYGGAGQPKVNLGVRGGGIIDTAMRLTRGDRRLMDILSHDNIAAEFNMLFDPEVGIVPRRFAANMVVNLQEAGMRFVQQSNGTIRGFWTNSRNEVVRDPVVSKLYESTLRATGGEGSPRLQDLSVTQLTPQQTANLFIASGLSWLVDPATNTPIPGVAQPTPAAPTPSGGSGPAPTPGTPVTPTYNGKPVGPGATPAPTATGTPAPTPTPPPVIPTRNGQPVGPGATPPPTPTGGTGPAPTPIVPTHNGQPVPQPSPTPARPPVPTPTGGPAPTQAPAVPPPKPTPQTQSRMPSVGDISTAHSDLITRALLSVPDNQRGFRWSVDSERRGKPTIIWGQPTASEIAAIANLRGKMPDTIVDNMVKVMESLQSAGGERPVFQGRYVRIQSHRTSATTETRKYIGNEYQFVADETFVPLHAESTTRYWNNDGSSVLSQAEYEKLRPAEQGQYTPREGYTVTVFNVGKFNQNLSTARSEGLRIYDKDGNVTGYVKDLAGNEITAKRFNELFLDDAEFHTLANQWMSRYLEGGPIDPTSVQVPGGKVTEPSAALLGNGDLALGEARLTALRATFGMTVRKGRQAFPTNFTNQVTRGMNFPFHTIDPTFLGPIQDTGARSLIAQEVVTRGQFNMSPAAWDKISKERLEPLRQKFLKVNPSNELTASWVHPTLPNTYIHEFNGRAYDVYIEGTNVELKNARSFEEAVAQSNNVRLEAEKQFETSQYAERLLREEAKRNAAAEAKNEAEANKNARNLERSRTKAEEQLLKEVRKGNEEWFDIAEAISNREAQVIREHEAATEAARLRGEQLSQEAQAETQDALAKLQAERARINRQLREDIIRREAERQARLQQTSDANQAQTARGDRERAEAAQTLREDIIARNAERQRREQEASTENQAQTARGDRERAEAARRLREDILARDAERKAEEAQTLADALNSKEGQIDLAQLINSSIRVAQNGMPVLAVNQPFVIRRIGSSAPFATRSAGTSAQTGPAVTATTGNTRAAELLGSPQAAAAVPTVRQYFGRTMGLSIDLQNAINNVWKTEMGNQLVAYYNGLNNKGKAVYTYHIYGINGNEIYRTQEAQAAVNALRINEERLRNPGKNVPDKGISKRDAKIEFYRSMPGGGSVLEQSFTKTEREIQQRAANRYK